MREKQQGYVKSLAIAQGKVAEALERLKKLKAGCDALELNKTGTEVQAIIQLLEEV